MKPRLRTRSIEPVGVHLMERVLERDNLKRALNKVRSYKGAPGIDGRTVDELPGYLKLHWPCIREQLLKRHLSAFTGQDGLDPEGGWRGSAAGRADGTGSLHSTSVAVLDGLDPDGLNIGAARGFEQGRGIGRISLIAFDIGPDVTSWQQTYFDSQRLYLPSPIVGTAARFHDDE